MGTDSAGPQLLSDRLEIRLGGQDKDRIRDRAAELGYYRGTQPDMTAYILDLVRADMSTVQHTVSVGEAMGISAKLRGLRLHPDDLRHLVEVERQVRAAGRFANELLRLDQTGRTPRPDAMAKAAKSLNEAAARLFGLIDPVAGRTQGGPPEAFRDNDQGSSGSNVPGHRGGVKGRPGAGGFG